MDIEKIVQELNGRFEEPLPDFYDRRIIFWTDEDGEFRDKLDEIILKNAKIVELTDRNMYSVKKLLCEDDLTSNYLVYRSLYFEKDEDNWLLNVELYSGGGAKSFRADLLSVWINDMDLPVEPGIREKIKQYRKFFNAKDRRDKIKALGKGLSDSKIPLAITAVLCGNKDISPANIVKAVLSAGLDNEENQIYKSFLNYGVKDFFWKLIAKATGYHENEDSNLRKLAIHIFMTAAARTMDIEDLKGLAKYVSEPNVSWCYDFLSEWLHGKDNDKLHEIANVVERDVDLYQYFHELDVEKLEDTEIFPCIDKCILIGLLKDISNQNIQIEIIRSIIEKRRTLAWYDEVAHYYTGIREIANMQEFFKNHDYENAFHTSEPDQIWNEYVNDYYKMDIYYREFQINFLKAKNTSEDNEELSDIFKKVAEETVERLYSNWFLGKLNDNWANGCKDKLKEFGYVPGVDQQEDFYEKKVRCEENRVFVIISDALRYEVAKVLSVELVRDFKCKVNLSSCEAIFPTATKFGMAALLPHKELSAEVRVTPQGNKILSILADGQSTDSGKREKVLQAANKNSVALKYAGDNGIINMKHQQRKELVKDMKVVYIYHDKIDASGHGSSNDDAVFPACEEAIKEIKNLVRIIVNELSGVYIIITADHGFLYTSEPLGQGNQVSKSTRPAQDIEVDRRYLITKKGANPRHLLPVKFLGGKTEYEAYAPMANVRIKKKGSDSKFTHGGISLQEMVVPVLEYRHLRSDSHEYRQNREKFDTKPVKLQLLSSSRKITNEMFYLDFYQKDPVGGNRSACTYLLYFEDEAGMKVSDIQQIIADKDTENRQDRISHCRFNLNAQKYNGAGIYYLVIDDTSGKQEPYKEEFSIDITLDIIDFDFSS